MDGNDPTAACMVIASFRTTADQMSGLLEQLHEHELLLRQRQVVTNVRRLHVGKGVILEIQEWIDTQAPQRMEQDEDSRAAWRAVCAQATEVHRIVLT